jgi:hypothetical protein
MIKSPWIAKDGSKFGGASVGEVVVDEGFDGSGMVCLIYYGRKW